MKNSFKIAFGPLLFSLAVSAQVATVHTPYYSLADYGAVPDAVMDTTCSMDGSTANLACADAPFSTCPTGKVVSINNALTGNLQLVTTISSCLSSSVAVLAISSTQATGSTSISATWGTDSLPALARSVLAATPSRGAVYIPSGDYLFLITDTAHVAVPSGVTILAGGGVQYLVGISGGLDPADLSKMLFFLPDGSSGQTFEGLNIQGEATLSYPPGLENQSAVIYGHGLIASPIDNVRIMNSTFSYLYGFSVHENGYGNQWMFSGNILDHAFKGVNILTSSTTQSNNILIDSDSMEGGETIVGNMFYNTNVSTGGGTGICPYNNVASNTFYFTTPGASSAISVGDCSAGSTITNNDIYGEFYVGIQAVWGGWGSIAGNLISGNNIVATVNSACNAGIYITGTGAAGNSLIGNSSSGCVYGLHNTAGANLKSGGNHWSGTSADVLLDAVADDINFDSLDGTGTIGLADGATLSPASCYRTSAGIFCQSAIKQIGGGQP